MSAVLITLIIAVSVIILAAMDNYYGLRKKELETKLRMAEMDAGIAPGTYSRLSKKDLRKARRSRDIPSWDEMEAKRTHAHSEEEEREELLKGISNLRTRIDNIDTIMHSRKEGEKAK